MPVTNGNYTNSRLSFAREKLSTITAIICITIVEIYALSQGIDGVALSTSIGIIAGLGGYALKNHQEDEI